MDEINISDRYKKSTRVRVSGILIQNDHMLLVKHKGLGANGVSWLPPGGGIEFNESAVQALKREFLEETGLSVEVGDFIFVNEYRDDRFHAIELFFIVKNPTGEVRIGIDPELTDQIITDVKYLSWKAIDEIPKEEKHNIFARCTTSSEIIDLKGFFDFVNIW